MSRRKNARTSSIRETLSTTIRLGLATLVLVGPLAAVTVAATENGLMPKHGAGLVLFVSLQRQSMS